MAIAWGGKLKRDGVCKMMIDSEKHKAQQTVTIMA